MLNMFGLVRRLRSARPQWCWVGLLWITLAAALVAGPVSAQSGAVQVSQNTETFTLDNGVITVVVSKRTGDLISMTYKGVETLSADVGGHSAVYWSHDTTGGVDVISRVTVDPASNGGERAEVSVKGISGGRKMGHGPGTATDGDIQLDIDTRYSLGRGDRGVYTYVAFDHRPEYGGSTMAEARIAVELAKYFDDIHVDDLRTGRYPLIKKDYDKYVYVTRQADERAYGWTSSTRKVGWFLLNPSAEYLSGGPNKAEFTAHGEPTVLNYWKSSHYGGSNVTVIGGERWTRVVGPFMFYVNEGPTHAAMVADAKAQLAREETKWPYGWVSAEGYAPPASRSEVVGQLVLEDRLAPNGGRYQGKLMVGLTKTPYTIPSPPATQAAAMQADGRFFNTTIEWQNDGKFLQHWSRNSDPTGRFSVPNVPPGTYTLHAYADGVMGEYAKADIVVSEGGKVDLGRLVWTPVRHGRTVWEVGVADRDAREFAYADHYFEPGSQLKYRELFPNGVTYRIGRSKPASDWFFVQAPTAPAGTTPTIAPFSGISGAGEATRYRIVFDMPRASRGAATLRLAFTTNSAPGIEVAVNGRAVGVARGPLSDNAITRHQIYGRFSETALPFDAALLRRGENILTLTVPAGSYNSGVVYDNVRLELDEAAPTPPAPTVVAVAPRAPGPAAVGARPAFPAPAPSQVVTIHDDAQFGLPDPTVNSRRFFARADAGGRKAVFVKGAAGAARRLVDPATYGTGSLGPWSVSPDGRRLAYAVAQSAAPNAFHTIRVLDTETGATLPDEVKWARYTSIAWSPDSRGFYYSGLTPPAEGATAAGGFHQVFHHTLGQPRASDRVVLWSDRGGMIHYPEITDDGRWLVVNGSVRADGKSEINLIDLTQPKPAPFKAMRMMKDNWRFAGSQGPLIYFVTGYGAERNRLVAIDTSKSSLPIVEIVPQAAEVLQAARLRDGKMHLSYADGAGARIKTIDAGAFARR